MVLAFIELGCTTAVDTWRHGPSHGSQTLRNGNGGRLTVYVLEYGPTPVRQKGQGRTGVILGAPHSPGRRPPSARSVKRSTSGSRQPSAGARRYPFDRLRSGPGARVWHEHSPLPLRVTRWASYAESSTTPCRTGPLPGTPRQVSGYRRPRGMNPSRSRTLNSGSSQSNSLPGETGS